MNLESMLFKHFGHKEFRQGQKEIIQDLMKGKDVLAMLPTGTGKSICYQLPALVSEGVTIVVSPLLSLMEDQVQQLKSSGEKRVIALNSFLSFENRQIVLEQLDKFKLIYVSPEILQSTNVKKALLKLNISFFVIDEAHCISQWGHEFRTDYLKLKEVRRDLGNPPCLAITATATEEVQRDIQEYLQLNNMSKHVYSIDRPNIAITVHSFQNINEKIKHLLLLTKQLQGPGMIYFSSRKWAENVSRILTENHHNVAYYHGGLDNEARILIQEQFIHDQIDIICCTNAFGMGINKPNIRYIIHFHYPSQMESYLQEIGRAGRDGKESVAIVLYSVDDHSLPQLLIEREFPEEEQISHILKVLEQVENVDGDISMNIGDEIGISDTTWRFLRYQLEQHGIFEKKPQQLMDKKEMIKKEILQTIELRKENKREKLRRMEAWLHSESCRRENFLDIFNEILLERPYRCCDCCGFELRHYYKEEKTNTGIIQINWKKELQHFLQQKENG